jgi:hypothetical protein
MQTNITRVISSVALIAVIVVSPAVFASNSADVTKVLASSTALELPAKAASLVAKASAADKQNVTVAVVKAAIGINPSAAVAIVSSVARENPATAPLAAVTATTLQHKRIDLITKAAAAAAPSEAARIVAALIKEFPQDYGVIAIAAAEGVPSAGREILAVVADYVPALQSSIQASTATFAANDGNVPVQAILSQSYNQARISGAAVSTQTSSTLAQTSATPAATTPGNTGTPLFILSQSYNQLPTSRVARLPQTTPTLSPTTPTATLTPTLSGPTLGPPYQPIPGPVTNISPSQIWEQQPGGHNEASP